MKQRDNIEELILKNREALNDSEPMDGHFARFENKLQKQHKKKRKLSFNGVLKVAAAIVFVLLASNQAFIYFSADKQGIIAPNSTNSALNLASVSDEYSEVEFYYTSAINSGMQNWNKLKEAGLISEEEQSMMDEELNEFENLYKSLQQDLETNPEDDRVINAMLEYYQAKLSVINLIINKLEDVQEQQEQDIVSQNAAI